MKCKFCDYEWRERTDNPISCPKCKMRFDYKYKRNINETEK